MKFKWIIYLKYLVLKVLYLDVVCLRIIFNNYNWFYFDNFVYFVNKIKKGLVFKWFKLYYYV